MTSKVRTLILAPVALVAFALVANTAKAEPTAHVPFNFSVEGKICPAGDYTIHRDTTHNLVVLQGRNSKVGYIWSLKPGSPRPTEKAVVLQFTEQGENHALRFVQYGPQTTSQLDKKNSNQHERETMRAVAGQ